VPIAASLVGLMVGGGLGYFGADRGASPGEDKQLAAVSNATNSWLDNVAEYHKLFVNAAGDSTFADIPAKDGDGSGEVIQKISQRTGQQGVRVPDLKPWGLVFQGARVVVIEGHAATQFVYTADNKTVGKAIGPLTVVVASTKRQDVAPTFDRRQDENLLYWRRKGHAYAIVGQADIGYMWGLANDIAWQLDAI
jgi:anti-sigma factor RsiW